jgi:hypothetical protein
MRPRTSTLRIQADYARTVEDVLTLAVISCIQHKSQILFSHFPLYPPRQLCPLMFLVTGLPSWVMDLNMSSHLAEAGYSYHEVPIGSDHTDFEEGLFERQNKVDMFSYADRFKRLHTFGSFIGTVVETTKNLLLNMDTPYFNPNSVAARVEALAQIDELMLRPRGVSLQKLCKDWYPTEDATRRIEPNLRRRIRARYSIHRRRIRATQPHRCSNEGSYGSLHQRRSYLLIVSP